MAKISWGKPRIWVKDVDAATGQAYELFTPVEDSTELTPNKGDKLEAKIEGGENEDVKYKRSTYALTFNIRKAKGRPSPFPARDGVVDHHYAIMLQPEDPTCEGFFIESNTVSVDDTYTAADGAIWQIQMDAVAATTGDTVKWGQVNLNAAGTNVRFIERSSKDGSDAAVSQILWQVSATKGGSGTTAGSDSSY